MEVLLLMLAGSAGALLALQAAANLQLSGAVGGPLAASPLQLGVAAALLMALALGVGTPVAADQIGRVEPWQLAGGLASPIYITAGMLLFPRLGAVVAVGLFIAGQMLASLVLDGFGLIGLPVQGFTPGALAGAVAVAGGTAVIVHAQSGTAAVRALRGRPAWIVLGLVAGAGLPVQAAINARLRAELDAPLTAAALSFTVATGAAALLLVAATVASQSQRPQLTGLPTMPWWGWLGGFAAATYVTVSLVAVPVLGAATTVALTVAGQQLASAVVDHYGLLRLPLRRVTTARLAGIVALLAGAALIQLA